MPYNTRQVAEILELTRPGVVVRAKARGVKPRRQIVNGRVHDLYTKRQLKVLGAAV